MTLTHFIRRPEMPPMNWALLSRKVPLFSWYYVFVKIPQQSFLLKSAMMAVAAQCIFTYPSVSQIAPGLHVHRSKPAFGRHCETAASAESDCGVVENSLSLFCQLSGVVIHGNL